MFASNMLIKDDTLVQEVGTTGAKTPLKTFMKVVHSGAEMSTFPHATICIITSELWIEILTSNLIASHFCPECGTTMYRTSSRFPGHSVMKIGTIDDLQVHDVSKPVQEHFARSRVAWLGPIEGALECETDPF